MTDRTRVLMEGTIQYRGSKDGSTFVDWLSARVFVLDWQPPSSSSYEGSATVIAREPIYLPRWRPSAAPSPIGSIHSVPVYDNPDDYDDGYQAKGNLLTVDAEPMA